jgi:hypothetical protein
VNIEKNGALDILALDHPHTKSGNNGQGKPVDNLYSK